MRPVLQRKGRTNHIQVLHNVVVVMMVRVDSIRIVGVLVVVVAAQGGTNAPRLMTFISRNENLFLRTLVRKHTASATVVAALGETAHGGSRREEGTSPTF